MKSIFLILFLILVSCGKSNEAKDSFDSRKAEVEAVYDYYLNAAEEIRDENGWLNRDCDGMIWSGKYAASTGVTGVNILAAEFDGSGRFGRRPAPHCWNEEEGDVGSKTTWSRDMGVAGLFPWAWRTKNLDALERHKEYGLSKLWKMGEPLDDGRTVYTPQMIGLLYQTIYGLGGENSILRNTPQTYPSGLDDYQAHLQIMNIWLRGEIEEELKGASLTEISGTMLERVEEHTAREPRCWTYSAMAGIYRGTMEKTIDLILSGDFECSYVRCDDERSCQIAEKIWSLDLVLRRLK